MRALVLLVFASAAWAQDEEDDQFERSTMVVPISHRSREERLAAVRQAEESKEQALRSIRILAALIADEDPAIRGGARKVLEGLGEEAWRPLALAGGLPGDFDEPLGEFLFLRGEAIIPILVAALREAPRCADARALARFGGKAVPALAEAIQGGKPGAAPVQMLAAMGADARPALDALRKIRGSERDHGTVAFAIARITPDADERRRMLLAAIRDPELGPVDEVVDALVREGDAAREAVPRLMELLAEHPDAVDLMRAIYRIERDGRSLLPYVVHTITRRTSDQRRYGWGARDRSGATAALLKEMGAAARPASGAILEQLACEDNPALEDAMAAVGVDPALVPRLRGWLRSGTARARWMALRALESLGPDAAPAVPEIARLLGRSDVGRHAARWLNRSGLPPGTIALGLAKALDGADEDLACTILGRLGKLGEDAKDALPAIRRACREPGGRAYAAALDACAQIGPAAADAHPEAVLALEQQGEVRSAALQAFQAFGERARAAVPALRGLMGDKPSLTGIWAGTAMLAVAPGSKGEMARYAGRCLKEPDLQAGALWMLVDTGDAARPYLGQARELLKARNPTTRVGAAYLLASRNTSVKPALGVLAGVLRSGDPGAVEHACAAIQRLGKVAQLLDGVLREVLAEEKDAGRRELIQGALDAIR